MIQFSEITEASLKALFCVQYALFMLSSTLENNFDIPQFVKMASRVMHAQRKPLGQFIAL